MNYERAWLIGEKVGKTLVSILNMLTIARAFTVILALHGVTFAASDTIDPGCNAAQKVSSLWGLIQVAVVGAVTIALLIASVGAFMERRGGWAGVLFFASFILGGVAWVAMDAIGKKVEEYASSCGSG